MDLRVRTEGGVSVVALPGPYLDASNHKNFVRALTPVFQDTGQVVLDFSALDSVDSSGLGAVAWAMREARSAGGALAVCGVRGAVQRAFYLVHFERIIRLFEDDRVALTWFEKGCPKAEAGA